MPRKRKSRKNEHRLRSANELKWFKCSVCKRKKIKTYESVKSVTCSRCLMVEIGLPETPEYLLRGQGKPRGWHFRRFFEYEGKVYSFGTEVLEKREIDRLRKEHKKNQSGKKKKRPNKRK